MKVEYVFSNNNRAGSKLIKWASSFEKLNLDTTPSHVAILLNDKMIIESTLFTGVRIAPYSKWLEINELVARIPCSNLHRPSSEVVGLLMDRWNRKYDWMGIAFFALSYLRFIVFKTRLPETNKWQNPDKDFCSEYVSILSGEDLSMKSPARILKEWSK